MPALLALVLVFFLYFPLARAGDDRSFDFPTVLITAEVHPDGSMTIVEERTFSFRGFWKSAWENIPLKYNTSIKDVSVGERNTPYRQMSPGTQDIPGVFYVKQHHDHVYIDWSFEASDENRTFIISYTVDNAVLVHDDVAELYYQFIGDEWEERTDYARVVLKLPPGAATEELLVWSHGPLHGKVTKEGPDRVVWEVENLPGRTFLEGRVVFPVELVPLAADFSGEEGLPGILAEEKAWAARANRERLLARLDYILGPLLLLAAVVLMVILRRRSTAHPGAFSGDYYRELPGDYSPAEAGYLYRLGRNSPHDFTATVLDLVRRGHLHLEEFQSVSGKPGKKESTDFHLFRREGGDPLSGHEEQLVRFIFEQAGGGDNNGDGGVSFKEIEKFARKNPARVRIFYHFWNAQIKQAAEREGFFKGHASAALLAGIPLPFLGVLLMIKTGMVVTGALAFLSGLVLLLGAGTRRNLSAIGADHYAKWRAFRRFLLHFSEMERSAVPALEIWEHYLVYAVVLGVAKKVLQQLQVVYPQVKEERFMVGRTALIAAAAHNPARFNNLTATMQRSFRTAFSASSSGSGRGGGFSGGGGGGRGGGGGGAR